jgi:hypothetical protein
VIWQVSSGPLAASKILGADTVPTLRTRLELAILVKTATIESSIPAKFPWLSNAGTAIKILKLARGAMVL